MELLEEIKTAADDLTADELEKVLQYIQTVKHGRITTTAALSGYTGAFRRFKRL